MTNIILMFAVFILISGRAQAQTSTSTATTDRMTELERHVDALTQELERLKLEGNGSSRDKDWFNHIALGGYGEAVYTRFAKTQQNGAPAGKSDVADLQRTVLYVGYHFNEWILFNSEFEIEHAGTGTGSESRGEAGMEQAYLDFKFAEPFRARAGMILIPMGIINETHEPTTFHGVFRPNVETFIIPTTWRELGAGFLGQWGTIAYKSYVVTGRQAAKTSIVDGFSGSSGIREGTTEGSHSLAQSLAWVSRLDFHPIPGVTAGGSFYTGEADQDLIPRVPVVLWDAHAQGELHGVELRVLYSEGLIGNTGSLNLAQAAAGADGFTPAGANYVGRRLFGGYVEPAFNILTLRPGCKQYLALFARYERYDTQSRVPNGFTHNPANSRVEYTMGLTYRPITQVILKGDYQWLRNEALTGVNQLNLGIGYAF